MCKNKIQFQKSLNSPEFMDKFGAETQCESALEAAKWPDGFLCTHYLLFLLVFTEYIYARIGGLKGVIKLLYDGVVLYNTQAPDRGRIETKNVFVG